MRRHRSAFFLVLTLYSTLVSSGLPLRGQGGDTEPPVIQLLESGSALADGALFNRAVQPVVQVTDASALTVGVTLDGVPFTTGATVSGEGQHTLAVTATDAAENSAEATVHFEIDTHAPVFTSVLPVSGSLTAAAQVTLQGELEGAASLTVDGQAATLVGGQWSAGPYTLAEGERTWTLVAADLAGNSTSRTHKVVRDATQPSVAIGQPAEGTVRSASPIQVSGTASDAHLEGVTVNGTAAALAGTTWVAANVPLAEGQTQLMVVARDAAGNTRTVQRAVALDTHPPAVAITDPAPGTVVPGATLTVGGTAADPHLDRVEVNGVRAQLANGAWSASVALSEGANDITARAFDTLGQSAADTVAVLRDSHAPAIHIEQPADGAYLSAPSVQVQGTVEQEAGLTVTVNGAAATVTGGTFTAAAVPLVEGENRLIARVVDHLGNQGAHTQLVWRDTAAPRFAASEPASGALALPLEAEIDLTFSEPLRTPLAAGALRLETAAGQAIAAQSVVAGSVVTVRPQAALPSHTAIRLVLTAGLVDRAGNALAAPPTLTFTTVDRAAPPAPVLTAPPPAFVCAPRLALSGTAEADATVQVTGGAGSASARAGANGAFAVAVDLLPEALNHLELVARDSDGNRSAPLAVEVVHDCTPPRVSGAQLAGGGVSVAFSERIAAASLAGAVTVESASGPVAGSTASAAAGTGAVFTPSAALPAGPLRVGVSQAVTDLAGNPLAFPYSGVLGTDVTESFVAGRVLDNATGRPLSGAVVAVVTSNGVANPEPQPEQTTAADGRFRIPVAPGTHTLLIARRGWTPVLRAATTAASAGTDVFDPRLTPAATPATIGTAGGVVNGLTVPAAALAAPAPVAVTALEEQGLPALLPYGWSPRGAAWVDLNGAVLASAAALALPVDAPDGTSVAIVRLDLATLQWHTLALATVAGGRVTVPVAAEGGFAVVEADPGAAPPAPAAAVAGTVLGSSPAPTGSEVTAAALTFNPATVLPSQRSLVTVDYTVTGTPPSGVPLTLTVREELTLLDGGVRRQAPYEADVVMYRRADTGAPRSRFGLRPSEEAQTTPLEMGAEDVTVDLYAGESVRGNVLGPVGGSVASPEGDRVDVPANALPEPTAVSLARRAQADLPKPVPAGTAFLGLLELDLSGRELAAPALLTLELGEAPAAGQSGLLFQVVQLGGAPSYRPVAALAATATGWTTAPIDPADLPWPGVRESGLYLFARLTAGVGYLRGTVYDVDGAPLARALVSSPAVPWIQLASGGAQVGRYVLPAAPGTFTATAENRATANTGSAAATITAAGARVDLDLLIRLTGPRVVEVVPANGAVNVLPGVEPTVRFSEPVDPATIASGVLLYDGAALVPTRLDVQGALVRIRPQATLRPAAVYELRINTAARDLQGHRLEDAVTSAFTTQASQVNSQLDLSRVHLLEPVNGNARVLGRPGAVPAGTVLIVEKTTGTGVSVTGTAGSDGSFELPIAATLADTILLHVVLQGQNEIILELTPFLTADGRGAHVAADRAATFSTLDGVTVKIAAGTFRDPAVVRLAPVAKATVTVPRPADLPVVAAFNLDFGGIEAQKPLQISMPTPAGVTHDDLLLSRVSNILGQDYWMLYDLMRRSNGRITTELLPDETAEGAGLPQAVARVAALQPSVPTVPIVPPGAPRQIIAASRRGDGKEYLPGAANPGLYLVMENTTFLDFVAFPFVPGMFAYFMQTGIDGCIAGINREVERLLAHDAVLMPTRRGERYTIVGRDLGTGFKLFERTFDPPAADTITELPPDNFGDRVPPLPVAGSPLRFLVIAPTAAGTENIGRGLQARLETGTPPTQGSLTITGDAGSVAPGAQVRLLGLDDTKSRDIHAGSNGAFSLVETVVPGNRYLLAIGAKVGIADNLEISFNEALPAGFAGIEVLDHSGRSVAPKLEPVGTRATVRIVPQPAWRAGETYTLHLKPSLADAAGNPWDRELSLTFEVEKSTVLDTLSLTSVRDIARLGSLLFIAADTQGLVVVDASDPAHLKNLIPGDITFPFPLADVVSGVTVDPHGRVLVAGGGLTGPGQLKIFDPLALDPAAVAANPNNPQVRYAAFKGSTIISDKLGADPGTSLPEGRPRRVTVLSDDESDRWRIGVDAPPSGVTVAPSQPPSADGAEYTVTVSGSNATAKMPVSFKNLTRGRFNRVDANTAAHYQMTLAVRAGDRVELLRNRGSYAYVATQGAGVEVVNVNAFYNKTPENPNTPSPESDVLGIYSGFEDPSLALCGQPVSDIGSALIDLGTLFDPSTPHPLTVVGLVGLRGLALLESDPSDVGDISFFNELCLNIGGSAQVSGMQVVENYPFDFDGDGKLEESEERDYIVVSHRTNGVLILDATDRDDLALVGWVKLPSGGQAAHVSLDRDRRRLYVSGYGGGVYTVDFDKVPSTQVIDKNQDAIDDRVLETIALAGNTNAAVFLLPELGVAYAGGVGGGLTSVAVGTPRLTAVTEDRGAAGTPEEDNPGRPRWRTVRRLAPLGVSADPEFEGEPDLPASFRVLASLPGVSGDTVKLDVVGLGPAGLPMPEAGPDTLTDLPRAALTGSEHGVVLHRLADHRWEEGYQLYLSDEIVALADLRGARHYDRSVEEKEEENCQRCDPEALKIPEDARELLSGNKIAVRFSEALRASLAGVYDSRRLDGAEISLDSVAWDIAPALHQEPAQNPPSGAAPGVLLSSGEMTQSATDLAIAGRGFDFALRRFYRSQTVGSGPFGPGWDFNYHQRLRELPNGDVELFDGSGRRELFVHKENGFEAPKGVFVSLDKVASGWVLLDAGHNITRFDVSGRLVAIADAVKDSADTGNEMTFHYDSASHLVRVRDTLRRDILFTYDTKGRIIKITDFDDRAFTYEYDAAGRLVKVLTPPVPTASVAGTVMVTQVEPLATEYTYNAATGGLAQTLNTRDNLVAVKDAKSQSWLSVSYGDPNQDQRNDEVTGQVWGGGSIAVQYQFGARQATVTDPRGHNVLYTHTAAGQVQKIKDAKQAEALFEYDAEGLKTKSTAPLGRVTRYFYDTPCDGTAGIAKRRSRGNLTKTEITPDDRGVNGSAASLVSCIDYEPLTNQPVRIVDPRGIVTRIERNAVGLPELVEQAVATPDASTTRTAYNDFGQPVRVVNPNGHATTYQYFTAGPRTGYLEKTTADPDGLALTTRFESDARGNVTAIADPRGVRHERKFNDLNWLTESRRATTAALDGAPALGYVTRYFYDPNGNLVETQLPYDDGSALTRVRRIFGPLDELLQVQREIKPGDPLTNWTTETNVYDENRNLERTIGPDGQITKFNYDERNQVEKVTAGFGAPEALATLYTYDLEGQPLTVIDPRGAIWTTHYDGYGRPRETIDPLNNRSLAVYDNASQPVEASAYEGAEKLLARRSTAFDALGRPKSLTSKLWTYDPNTPDLPLSARDLTTRWEYDAASNLKRMIDPLQRATVWEYDAVDRQIASVDALGNRVEHDLDPAGNPVTTRSLEKEPSGGTVTVTTHAVYDALGRAVESRDGLNNVATMRYDARSNVRFLIDPEQAVTQRSYDGLDRMTRDARPEGITVDYGYDQSSRLTSYTDALHQSTTYTYDALNRRKTVQYPDNTHESYAYDEAGNLWKVTDAKGTLVTQSYDLAHRLTGRAVAPSSGVEGPFSEVYAFDGLGRMTRAQSGNTVTDLRYDSLSRLLREETAGKALGYSYDDAGNRVRIDYPSGYSVRLNVDHLNRATSIGQVNGTAPNAPFTPAVAYTYRGADLLAGKNLANGLTGTYQYDAARRLIDQTFQTATGKTAFRESLAWTPRSLKAAQSRGDENGRGLLLAYDTAGRLLQAAKSPDPLAVAANNTKNEPASLAGLPDLFAYAYDAAQNLLAKTEKKSGATETVQLPLDGSHRNRPGAIAGTALTWDANGNLIQKGDKQFHYDYRNRLTRVTAPSGEIASYEYDAFNRRLTKTVGGVTRRTVWDGWTAVEEYAGNRLVQRRTFGLGLDEMVQVETDLDGQGDLDATYAPLYDATGNLIAMTGADGKPIERYEYTPYGARTILVDSTAPAVEQVRVKDGKLWVEISEEIAAGPLAQAVTDGTLKLEDLTGAAQAIAVTVEQPVVTGRQARRRLIITTTDPPAADTQVRLTLPPQALQDAFLNQPAQPFELTFAWPAADTVLQDSTAPKVERVAVQAGILEVELSEEPDLAAATAALQIDGAAVTWTRGSDRYTLRATTPLAAGAHTVTIATAFADLSGKPLPEAFSAAFNLAEPRTQAVFEAADPRKTATSTIGNLFGYKGLVLDPETGLVYARNRYYDAETGRFITADPLGYTDGPSAYFFAGNDPANLGDPMGLCVFNLPCPEPISVLYEFQKNNLQTAVSIGKGIVKTVLKPVTSAQAAYTGTKGTVVQKARAAGKAYVDSQLDSATLGFYSAKDKKAHGKELVSSALGLKDQDEGSRRFFNGVIEGNWEEATRGGAQWLGGASQTVLTVASLGQAAEGMMGRKVLFEKSPAVERPHFRELTDAELKEVRGRGPADDLFLPDEYYDKKLNARAPKQSAPYETYERFDSKGNLKQVTTYDGYGDRVRQFDVGDTARHNEGFHTFEYDQTSPRHGSGGGRRSPHLPFDIDN